MVSYPNQRFVTIHKQPYFQDFMQVAKDEWMPAFADLTRGTFGLYLYLCGNMDNYRFALSSVAVQKALGVSNSTYRCGVEELLEKGHLIMDTASTARIPFFYVPLCIEQSIETPTVR